MRSANMASSHPPETVAPVDWLRHPGRIALIAWLASSAILIAVGGWPLTRLHFFDPDDALRLEQVRALVAGQSWFDVTQYRIDPPHGAPMHWSRIVDLPIAALILLAKPLIGTTAAEIFATMIVPLLLLGCLTAATYISGKWIDGGRHAPLLGAFILLTTPTILVQFPPFRIDHHGWQILMAAVATCGIFDPRPRRGGIMLGTALATWLAISSEALPYTALFLGVAGIQHLLAARDTDRLVGAAVAVGAMGLLLSLATRGLLPLQAVQCDALSIPYLFPLMVLAVTAPIAHAIIGNARWVHRLLVGAIGAAAAIVTLALVGGPCLSGDPFQSLGPLAYRVWYLAILEGRPVWEQDLTRMGVILAPPLGGLAATLCAAVADRRDPERLQRWLLLAVLLAGATAVAIMVMRAASVAHWLAIPGIAWLLLPLLARIQASSYVVIRVLGSVSLTVLTPFGLSALGLAVATPFASPADAAKQKKLACNANMLMPDVASLPPSLMFAPLDIGPTILARTHHRIFATGHHRNIAGINDTIRAYMGQPETARAIIMGIDDGRGADYLLTCNDLAEYRYYIKLAPNGLAAQLFRNHPPAWLTPLPGKGPLHIYRINRAGN